MGDQVRTLLADEQWERIAPLALGKPGDRGVTGKNNRDFVEAVLWILRTGAPWRDLPQWFGKWPTVYKRFARWCQRGVWRRMREALRPNTPCIAVIWTAPSFVHTSMPLEALAVGKNTPLADRVAASPQKFMFSCRWPVQRWCVSSRAGMKQTLRTRRRC